MADNVTTLLTKTDAGDLSLTDLLYLVQGTGEDRDRKLTLQKLADFIQKAFSKIYVAGESGSGNETTITAGAVEGYTGGAGFKIAGNIVQAGNSAWGFEALKTGMQFVNSGLTFQVNGDGISFELTSGAKVVVSPSGIALTLADGTSASTQVTETEVDTSTARVSTLLNVCSGALIAMANQVNVGKKLIVNNDANVNGKLTVGGDIEMGGSGFLRLGDNMIASDTGSIALGGTIKTESTISAGSGFKFPIVTELPSEAAEGTTVIFKRSGNYKLCSMLGGNWLHLDFETGI